MVVQTKYYTCKASIKLNQANGEGVFRKLDNCVTTTW